MKKRVILLILDSLGIGYSADAAHYGDHGANTLGHIAKACLNGQANQTEVRQGPLYLPNLGSLGLYQAAILSNKEVQGLTPVEKLQGAYGYGVEMSHGKDTPSGHWEIAGLPVLFDWGYFPETIPCFPEELTKKIIEQGQLPGILGNKHASGTEILAELGALHLETKKPILYTSADSVLQIAAHEELFGLERLYQLCEIARKLVDTYKIGRVIARPFTGKSGSFIRTANRKDYTTPPHGETILQRIIEHGGEVISVGKIADIFAHQGITQAIKAKDNASLMQATIEALRTLSDHSLLFSNLVDFDTKYGHRRDVIGYAHALEQFDQQLGSLLATLKEGDLLIISADHGCDPTWHGTDHTREHSPILVTGPHCKIANLGRRETFADIGQTIVDYFDLPLIDYGNSFLQLIR